MAFGEQAARLLRESWKDANALAREVYAIFSAIDEGGFDSLKVNNKTGNPAIQVTQDSSKLPTLPDGSKFPKPPVISTYDPQTGTQSNIHSDGTATQTAVTPPGSPSPTGTPLGSGGGGGGLIGTVQAGSGSIYTVLLLGSGQAVQAIHPQIASGEQIPAGRYVAVFLSGGTYYILEPTWL